MCVQQYYENSNWLRATSVGLAGSYCGQRAGTGIAIQSTSYRLSPYNVDLGTITEEFGGVGMISLLKWS